MSNRKNHTVRMVTAAAIGLLLTVRTSAKPANHATTERTQAVSQRDEETSAAAFESIVPVLRHPRCINCHSTGDFPRQGDDSHRHTMEIRRGPDGQGANAVKCSTCHQDHNLAGLHMPPGAPDWHLPSPAMPMIWQGLTDRQLCELFKDPKQNGIVLSSRSWSTCTRRWCSGAGIPEPGARP